MLELRFIFHKNIFMEKIYFFTIRERTQWHDDCTRALDVTQRPSSALEFIRMTCVNLNAAERTWIQSRAFEFIQQQ